MLARGRPPSSDPADGHRKLGLPGRGAGRWRRCGRPGPTRSGWAGASSPSTPRSPQRCEEAGIVFVGPDSATIRLLGGQGRGQAAGGEGRRPGGAVERPARGPMSTTRPSTRGGSATRCCSRPPPAAAGAASGWSASRRSWPRRWRRRAARPMLAFGDPAVFLEAVRAGRAARRGAGHRRPPRHDLGGRRAGLQHPAAQPEGHRGVGVDRAGRRRPSRRSRPRPCGSPSAAGYRNAGTVEFLVDPHTRAFLFMEVNTRLAGRAPGHRGRPPGSTSSSCSCTSRCGGRLDGGRRRPRARHRGPAVRRGPGIGTSRPRRVGSRCWRPPAGPGIRVDSGSRRGRRRRRRTSTP